MMTIDFNVVNSLKEDIIFEKKCIKTHQKILKNLEKELKKVKTHE